MKLVVALFLGFCAIQIISTNADEGKPKMTEAEAQELLQSFKEMAEKLKASMGSLDRLKKFEDARELKDNLIGDEEADGDSLEDDDLKVTNESDESGSDDVADDDIEENEDGEDAIINEPKKKKTEL